MRKCTDTVTVYNHQTPPTQNVEDVSSTTYLNGRKRRSAQEGNYNPPASYDAPTRPPKVLNPGKVIVMPPPGEFPAGYPQPGQPGGGARPETDPYIAAMAPDGTVPIAIYPPFQTKQDYPKKCVIFSQLTDFEDLEINDYGNVQVVFDRLLFNLNSMNV